jgi:hypothetical protein
MLGRTIYQKVYKELAPRSMEASTSNHEQLDSRDQLPALEGAISQPDQRTVQQPDDQSQ